MSGLSYPDDPKAFRHEAVLVQHGSVSAWIDTKIARLIKAMWESGLQAEQSCEETDTGLVFIKFFPGSGERFCRRLIGVDLDWSIFEMIETSKKDPRGVWRGRLFSRDFESGWFPFKVPLWSRRHMEQIIFPQAYIPKFEEIAGRPELENQGPKTIFGCVVNR